MHLTLAKIGQLVDGEVVGDADLVITGVQNIQDALTGDLTFIANPKYFPYAQTTKASAIIVPRDFKVDGKNLIRVANPSLAFTKILQFVHGSQVRELKGIHPTALIGKNVSLGGDVALGAYVVIDDDVTIGDKTAVYAGSYIGHSTVIGSHCVIYPNVTIREKITIANRVIIHSGTIIGTDGFGYEFIDGAHHKIPQIGTVVIEDDVEIGSNVTIDRARFDKTFIGRGTKIDNLVQIAHNVIIGENCVIISQTGISGSTVLGNNVILAGQSGLAGHLTIGDGAIVAAKSGILESIPPNTKVFGYPARPHMEMKRIILATNRLPEYIRLIDKLKLKVEELEKKLNER